MKKKLALLLSFALILAMIPVTVFACEECDEDAEYCPYEIAATENDEDANDEDDADEDANDEDDADEDDNDEDDADEDDNDEDDADEDANDEDDTDEDANDEDDEDELPGFTPPAVPVYPVTQAVTTLRFVIGETTFTRNDVETTLDVAPFIDAAVGRTMVPLAAISEGLGATVGWNDETRNVSIVRGDINLTINVDTELPDGFGMPSIVDDRTFVPLAYVSTMLGATHRWDADNQAIYIHE